MTLDLGGLEVDHTHYYHSMAVIDGQSKISVYPRLGVLLLAVESTTTRTPRMIDTKAIDESSRLHLITHIWLLPDDSFTLLQSYEVSMGPHGFFAVPFLAYWLRES